METLGNRQYNVRMDGSNRVTRRNRRFLRKINPVVDTPCHSIPEVPPRMLDTIDNPTGPEIPGEWSTTDMDQNQPETSDTLPEPMEVDDTASPGMMEVEEDQPGRRSRRVTRPPRNLSPQMWGTSHDYSRASKHWTTTQVSCGPGREGACRGGIEPKTPSYKTGMVLASHPHRSRLARLHERREWAT